MTQPDLLAIPRRAGCTLAIGAFFAILCGGAFTVALGAVGVGMIIGPIVVILGIIGIPIGLYGAAFPLSNTVFKNLGTDSASRRAGVADIEREMALPDSENLPFGPFVLSVTPSWIVLRDSTELMIARRDTLLWAYKSVTTHKRYGIRTGETVKLAIHVAGHSTFTPSVPNEHIPAILERLGRAAPRSFIGYRAELDGMAADRLRALCDAQPPRAGADRVSISASPGMLPILPTFTPPAGAPLGGSAGGKVFLWISGLGVAGLGLGALALVSCCGGLLALGTWAERRMAPLAQACSGHAVPGAASRAESSASRVAERDGAGWKIATGSLGDATAGSSVGDTAWVLCVEDPLEVVLERCPSGVDRVAWRSHLRLVEAATGTVLLEEDRMGDPPPECWSIANRSASAVGAKPGSSAWGQWLYERRALYQ